MKEEYNYNRKLIELNTIYNLTNIIWHQRNSLIRV
jgi:hypothetical protein